MEVDIKAAKNVDRFILDEGRSDGADAFRHRTA